MAKNIGIGIKSRKRTKPNFSIYKENVRLGLVDGVTNTSITANSQSVTNAVYRDIMPETGPNRAYSAITTFVAGSIVSTAATDVAAGAGAQTVSVTGLIDNPDNAGNIITATEVVTMTGLTPALTVNAYSRILDFRVVTAGATEGTDGAISITLGANVSGQIPASSGAFKGTTAQFAQYSTGSSQRAFLRDFSFFAHESAEWDIIIEMKDSTTLGAPFIVHERITGLPGQIPAMEGFMIPPLHDFRVRAKLRAGGPFPLNLNYSIIAGGFFLA